MFKKRWKRCKVSVRGRHDFLMISGKLAGENHNKTHKMPDIVVKLECWRIWIWNLRRLTGILQSAR